MLRYQPPLASLRYHHAAGLSNAYAYSRDSCVMCAFRQKRALVSNAWLAE